MAEFVVAPNVADEEVPLNVEFVPKPPAGGLLRKAAIATAVLAGCAGVYCLASRAWAPVSPDDMPQAGGDLVGFSASTRGRSLPAFLTNSVPFLGGRGFGLSSSNNGRIKIMEDGVQKIYYLPGATVIDNDFTVEYRPPYRFYLMKELSTDYGDASKFYKPKFIGKTFTVDFDFGRGGTPASCGCNLNFYLVDMPVADPGELGDHYCDAQCFAGLGCCNEFDMNEGNANVQQITNHACTDNYVEHPDWKCHKWGEPIVKTDVNGFKLGGSQIDSSKKFTFAQEFRVVNGRLVVTTFVEQEGKTLMLTMGPNEQLDAMMRDGSLERGMAFVTGYWQASDMNWLDSDACGDGPEHCNNNPAYISNWRITTNAPGVCRWSSCQNGRMGSSWCNANENQCKSCGGGVWCRA